MIGGHHGIIANDWWNTILIWSSHDDLQEKEVTEVWAETTGTGSQHDVLEGEVIF
jgi:hypothetical protein